MYEISVGPKGKRITVETCDTKAEANKILRELKKQRKSKFNYNPRIKKISSEREKEIRKRIKQLVGRTKSRR